MLAEIVRLDRDHHRQVAGDTELVEAVKLLARAHQTAIWERTRHVLRMRSTLREYFPAALEAFEDLAASDALPCWRGHRARVGGEADAGPADVRVAGGPPSPRRGEGRWRCRRCCGHRGCGSRRSWTAPTPRSSAARYGIITALNEQIAELAEVVADHFGRHPAAEIYLSQPGLGEVLGSRVMGEFGDDKNRFADARARKNYSGQSPITRASGRRRSCWPVMPRTDASATPCTCRRSPRSPASPGARAYYDTLKREENRTPRRATPARQPARRHPARLPEDRHQVRREHGLAAPSGGNPTPRRLTEFGMGCLSA